ncbi:chemotaxis protein [Shewanella sp. WXL01]|uniref:chemotaxis protein n=1 Tax=Shewanella sp. WXL01 TaxID=2709721 RepID=UPI0032AE9B84
MNARPFSALVLIKDRCMSLWLALSLLVSVSGCSLLEVKLESGVEPLTQEQLNMRLFSREFSYRFYTQVETTADMIAANTDDKQVIANTLMWKINAEQNVQRAIFQAAPVAAMVDTWVFTEQMHQFFATGNGSQAFGEQQQFAIDASRALADQFAKTIKGFINNSRFERNYEFVKQYVAANPINDFSFSRVSAFDEWLSYSNINEFEAVTTFGTMPEVMSDMSDRMAMTTEQMPKILGWKAELYALYAEVGPEDIEIALNNMSETAKRFQTLMENSPEMMHQLAADLRVELTPLVNELSLVADDKLAQLSKEREAVSLMIVAERQAIAEIIASERAAAMQELDVLSAKTVDLVFEKVIVTIKSVILYVILFLLVVFFAPLGLGVWLGKRMGYKSALETVKAAASTSADTNSTKQSNSD